MPIYLISISAFICEGQRADEKRNLLPLRVDAHTVFANSLFWEKQLKYPSHLQKVLL